VILNLSIPTFNLFPAKCWGRAPWPLSTSEVSKPRQVVIKGSLLTPISSQTPKTTLGMALHKLSSNYSWIKETAQVNPIYISIISSCISYEDCHTVSPNVFWTQFLLCEFTVLAQVQWETAGMSVRGIQSS
jgi:hypothetical protein